MDAKELVALVAKMRELQRKYYSMRYDERPPSLLGECKTAERKVDLALEEFKGKQGRLFG